MIELVAALPKDRMAGFVTALGNRLTDRMCDMEIDERTDDAMVSVLAPVFAALSQRPIETQETWRGSQLAGCLSMGIV